MQRASQDMRVDLPSRCSMATTLKGELEMKADRPTTASTLVENLSEFPGLAKTTSTDKAPEEVFVNVADSPEKPQRGVRFWICIFSLMMSTFLIALDISGTGTALPKIVEDLNGTQFEWIGSAFTLSATAFLPLSGSLAQVFGRRPVMMSQLLLFAAGSALCGAAPSMNALIAGRAIQGVGAGGIASLTSIIIGDLVPLQERGTFNGYMAVAYGFAISSSPVIAGSLAQHGQWRWFFYMNLPLTAVAAFLVFISLDLRTPKFTLQEKVARMDWIGNVLVIGGSTSVNMALTWGGLAYAWSSPHIIVPLALGGGGLVVFFLYEVKCAANPLVPFSVLTSITTISGYAQTGLNALVTLGAIYYLPVYYQACHSASPTASGVDIFTLAYACVVFALVGGVVTTRTGRYREIMWLAWVLIMIGMGLLTTLTADTSHFVAMGYQAIAGAGMGFLTSTTFFPVLAPLSVALNAPALAFFMFVRYFAQAWGITIGGVVLQNMLPKRLPAEFMAQFPSGASVAYAVIPVIGELEEPLRSEVRAAFADGLREFWQVLIGVAALGFVSSLFMKQITLHTTLDEEWGLKSKTSANDPEQADGSGAEK